MNRTALLQSALRHADSPYTPYAINLTGDGYEAYGQRLLEDYAPEHTDLGSQIRADLKSGMISFPQAVSLAIGNCLTYVYCPWWNWNNLTDEFLKAEEPPERLPDTIGSGSYEFFFRQMEHLRTHYDTYRLVTIWGSHWEKAYFSRGIEHFLTDLAGSPEWAQAVLDLCIRKNLVMLENILSQGDFEGVLLGSDWGSQKDLIMSPEMFRRMIKPGEIREYELIHSFGKDVFVHSCGDIRRIMPDLVEMGVDGLNPVQPECMDLEELKRLYGNRICYYGGISTQKTLPYGTVPEVIRETENTIGRMSVHGGYITAPSQEIQTDVPYENLRALIDTARACALPGPV